MLKSIEKSFSSEQKSSSGKTSPLDNIEENKTKPSLRKSKSIGISKSFNFIQDPKDSSERVDLFLANLNELHETRDPLIGVLVFQKFEFRSINYTEDHVRRIFSGNGLNQKGLLQFA